VPERAILESVWHSGRIARVVVAELNLGDFRREVERVVYRRAAEVRQIAPEIIGINRVDGELITPGQLMESIL